MKEVHVRQPKLILLGGPAGIGKTSLGKRYIDDHPLAFLIEGDRIITMLGQWLEREAEARRLVFTYVKTLVAAHLSIGQDVVFPYVPTNADHIAELEEIAESSGAKVVDILLDSSKEDAIRRLLKRGTWGEEGTPPITEADLPEISALFDKMTEELQKRPGTIRIDSVEGAIDDTYKKLIKVIDTA